MQVVPGAFAGQAFPGMKSTRPQFCPRGFTMSTQGAETDVRLAHSIVLAGEAAASLARPLGLEWGMFVAEIITFGFAGLGLSALRTANNGTK
jgi:hypothetical protein